MAERRLPTRLPFHFDTLGVHTGLTRTQDEVKEVPIYASTSFSFNDSAHGAAIFNGTAEAFAYSRIANPTVSVFEKRMAALEGGEAALATSSGSAALLTAITALAQSGNNIVVASRVSEPSRLIFTHRLAPFGISTRFVESGDIGEVRKAIDDNTGAVFAESIATEGLQITDIKGIAEVTHDLGVPLIIDNTAGAGGFFVRPMEHGADIVIESGAEWLSISGSNTSGVIIDSGNFGWQRSQTRFPQFFEPSPGFHGLKMWEKFGKLTFITFARAAIMRDTGPCMNPFEAFQLLAGLETLFVRMERISSNALQLAQGLMGIDGVLKVKYLHHFYDDTLMGSRRYRYLTRGGGGLVSFVLSRANKLNLEEFKIVSVSHTIGGSRTVVISDSLSGTGENPQVNEIEVAEDDQEPIYVSVGLENIDDILEDFAYGIVPTDIDDHENPLSR